MVAKREALCHATGKILPKYQTIFLKCARGNFDQNPKTANLRLENNLNLTNFTFFSTLDSCLDNETCNINADKYFTKIFTKKDVLLKHKISLTINSIQYGCKYCKQH